MTAITDVDVPAVLAALLAKATVPGPRLRPPSDELRTWFLLAVHPDDEAAMSAMVEADPWMQATVTVRAGELPDRGMAYLIDQDRLKNDIEQDVGQFRFADAEWPLRSAPSWLLWSAYVAPLRPANLLAGA